MSEQAPADPGRFFVKVLADQHYQKGVHYAAQGDWAHALAAYRRACAYDPGNVLFLLARGHLCQAHGPQPEAEACYREALRLRPNDPIVLYNQAQLFAARGDLDRARANLTRIVDGEVDALEERAAPIFCRLGDIALRREDYDGARVYFQRAQELAPGHHYATAALTGLPRFAEFEAPFTLDGRIAPKIAVYGYLGAVLLGMPDDDGIDVPAYPGLGFDSLAEVAQVLARFAVLVRRAGLIFDAVAALEAESQPMAIALASALAVRSFAGAETVPHGSRVLGIAATGAQPAHLAERVATLRGRASETLVYAVGLAEPVWDYPFPIQAVTAPIRLEYPWNRKEASALEHAEAYGGELATLLVPALVALPGEYLEAQLAWYRAHPRLNFALTSASPMRSRAPSSAW